MSDAPLPENTGDEPMPEMELNALQEAYLQKLFATYKANLCFFQEKYPYIFKALIESDAEVPFTVDEDGKLTLLYRNTVGHPKDFIDLGKTLFRFFDDPKVRPHITTTSAYVDDEKLVAPQADLPYFYHPVEPEFRLRLVRRFKELNPVIEDKERISRFGDKKLLIAIAFGVGYGWDINQIIDQYEIRQFIIIEPNARNLNLSMFFVDYLSLYHRFMDRGGKHFTILTYDPADKPEIEESPEEAGLDIPAGSSEQDIRTIQNKALAHDLRQAIRVFWPPYMARGAGLHFNDYRSEDVKEIWKSLGQEFFLLYMGWGFFDDEVLSLLNATQNLYAKPPLCTRLAKGLPADSTAFVIGSGPSLDEQLPLIEANRDKAIVISCGTALTVLARRGIKPDFHVEIERTDLTYEFMVDPKHRDFIKDVPLLLIPAIPPKVFELTERPLMLLKFVDAGTQLTDIDNTFPRFSTGPTVTNCGTDFCLRMGIKNIYLMGVDVGYPAEGPHHSTLSHYYDTDHASENLAEAVKATDVACARRLPVPGNFGDTVHSTEIFIQARDLLAQSIAQFPGSKVYNLNRGAAIKGTTPLQPADFVCPGKKENKTAIIDAVLDCFSTAYNNDPDKNIRFLCEQMDAVQLDVQKLLVRPYKNKLEVCDALADFEQYLNAPKHAKTAVFPMLRGSMLHLCRIFFECLTMTADEAVALRYAEEGIQIMLDFMNAGQELIARIPTEARRRAGFSSDLPAEKAAN